MVNIDLRLGDCLEILPTLNENSVDTVITDPPYGLEFMDKDWDHGIPSVQFWIKVLRVAKPGATLLAFGGTRTHHRLMVVIEDAGWEIRDCIMWVYGSGFPKSHNIGKAIDKASGAEPIDLGVSPNWRESKRDREKNGQMEVRGKNAGRITEPATEDAALWDGWGTALKPAYEPIIVAMKPIDGTFVNNALEHGVAGLWIEGARVEVDPAVDDMQRTTKRKKRVSQTWEKGSGFKNEANPLTGVPPNGRWPANFIHDGSDEVLAGFPVTGASKASMRGELVDNRSANYGRANGARIDGSDYTRGHNDNGGSAARFFYCAKSSRSERNAGLEGMDAKIRRTMGAGMKGVSGHRNSADGKELPMGEAVMQNHHPTVKPLALMEYLCKLTRTPTGGVVLDPFLGSGSTGIACIRTDRDFIGIEIEPKYFEIAEKRIAEAQLQIRMEI